MIKMMVAYTTEVDEVEDALAEILSQLDVDTLLKNSVGIITCHCDFLEADFLELLSERLPFNIVGMTTLAGVNRFGMGLYGLSLSVLTSDDVVFKIALSAPLDNDNYFERMQTAYDDASSGFPGKPDMIIAFLPYIFSPSAAVMAAALDKISGGVPIWGSLSTGLDISLDLCHTICNEVAERTSMAILLFYGPVDAEFIVVSIPEQHINESRAVITESDGCLLKKVNDIPVLEYLESLGVVIMNSMFTTMPFMVYYEGSTTPVALGVFHVYDDGTLLCGGEMTKGAQISIGDISSEGILASAAEGLRRVLEHKKTGGALMLPCVSRYAMLSPDKDAELKSISEKMSQNPNLPYSMGYSGGELCPVRDENGNLINRFHNYTFSACVLS